MKFSNKAAQQGFTMIELIMVIVILGILAAVALPRFYDLQTDARSAKLDGLAGAVRSASAIAHSGALVSGKTSGAQNLSMEGTTITLINGYPTADAAGIIAASNLNATNDNVTISTGGATAGSAITIQVNGATTAANCQISYTTSATAGTAPAIVATKTGC